MQMCDVVIVGAGPYGLSAAAHLRDVNGLDVRIFGEPMSFWERHMPRDMLLRSWHPASHISDPQNRLSLDAFGRRDGHNGLLDPLPVADFTSYGHWFHDEAQVAADRRKVERIEPAPTGYNLTLADGEILQARRVVVATGIQPFANRPAVFENLPKSLVTHSSQQLEYSRFKGKEVLVIGGGQSALECAAFMRKAGGHVEILIRSRMGAERARRAHAAVSRPDCPSNVTSLSSDLLENFHHSKRLLYGQGDVGPAGVSLIIQRPSLFRRLPRRVKNWSDRRAIRPVFSYRHVPADGQMPILERFVVHALVSGERVCVKLNDGLERKVDHVVLATGYRVNVALYSFLAPSLLQRLDLVNGYPRLNSGFESSVPGLHFLGAPAAWTFGPLVRFIAGTGFASRSLRRKILRAARH